MMPLFSLSPALKRSLFYAIPKVCFWILSPIVVYWLLP